MKIKIRFFAALKDLLECDQTVMEVPEGSSCETVLMRLKSEIPALFSLFENCLIAVNGQFADKVVPISADDEVAIMPPVSGG